MIVAWMLHPLRAYGPYTAEDNLARAKRWMKWCLRKLPEVEVCADWILWCELLDDANPEERTRGLRYDQEMTRRCDMIILCGGTTSSGMLSDIKVANEKGKMVVDLLFLGDEPPESPVLTLKAKEKLERAIHKDDIPFG